MTQEQSVVPPQDGGNYTDRDGLEHPHRLPVLAQGALAGVRWPAYGSRRDLEARAPNAAIGFGPTPSLR